MKHLANRTQQCVFHRKTNFNRLLFKALTNYRLKSSPSHFFLLIKRTNNFRLRGDFIPNNLLRAISILMSYRLSAGPNCWHFQMFLLIMLLLKLQFDRSIRSILLLNAIFETKYGHYVRHSILNYWQILLNCAIISVQGGCFYGWRFHISKRKYRNNHFVFAVQQRYVRLRACKKHQR